MINFTYDLDTVRAACDEIDSAAAININDLADDQYNDMLDESYSFECVGGIFADMQPSRVLELVDPIAYREGFSEYVDSLYTDLADDHTELDDEVFYPDTIVEQALDQLDEENAKENDNED